ncbi:glycosyltransferase family 2 protein [Pseudophaeobacter arcticus]|uniref:glycosyltransferase family 2 protein n=1 Tax=Pseudophaeobacter arcticus TaxID=385492 RepID=UPI0039E517ED
MKAAAATALLPPTWRQRYRLRLKRRQLLWRSLRSRHQLRSLVDRSDQINRGDLLGFVVLRNESARLPYFLDYYRALGVKHFLVVDNGSNDGSAEFLTDQPDVSLWQTQASYREARFGLNWSTWLQMRYGHGHWCLTVDADELLVYDGIEEHDLSDLTARLGQQGLPGFGAMMLDLYPRGALGDQPYAPGQDPLEVLNWFDAGPYRATRQSPMGNLWLQGGTRERVFFAARPERSPTLNKIPLVKWNRRYAYVNSTHSLLPPALNGLYEGPGGKQPAGVLLHTKFLPEIVSKSATEKQRQQHFHRPQEFDHYYDELSSAPDLWQEDAQKYRGPGQLCELGLMPELRW